MVRAVDIFYIFVRKIFFGCLECNVWYVIYGYIYGLFSLGFCYNKGFFGSGVVGEGLRLLKSNS